MRTGTDAPGGPPARAVLPAVIAQSIEELSQSGVPAPGEQESAPPIEWRAPGDYVEIARRYCEDVLAGDIPACKWTKAAVRRHLDDLARSAADVTWPYAFSVDRAEHICKFIELLPHIKGDEWAGKPIRLEPWQVFILVVVFGWLTRGTNYRRFRTVYIEVPRKNAKSTLSSAVSLYMLTADREAGAEIYSAATTQKQARIVFDDARMMAAGSPKLRARFGVKVYKNSISCSFQEQRGDTVVEINSLFQALSAEGSTLDGLNIHFASVDELHAHKKRDVFDVLETGTGSRRQSLLWAITTAGSDTAGICYEQRKYVVRVLNTVLRRHEGMGYPIKGTFLEDETYFGIIYTIDDDDDWTKPECWAKANPNYNVSVYPDDIKRLADKAIRVPSARSNFLTKRLNKWVAAADAWMDMLAWDKCADPTLKPEQFRDDPCWIPLDLASKKDIAEKGRLFTRNIDGRDHYYYFGTHYLPELAATDESNSQYAGWVHEGWLKTTPGNITDYDVIEADIIADAEQFNVIEVPYDPHQATQLSTHLMAKNIEMVEVKPTVLNFSEPMKEFEALVIDGRFHHNGDPVLTWMVGNIVAFRDNKDNIYPRKESEEKKIDGGVAIIMGLARAITGERKQTHSGELMVV